jgi:hypothetical protein
MIGRGATAGIRALSSYPPRCLSRIDLKPASCSPTVVRGPTEAACPAHAELQVQKAPSLPCLPIQPSHHQHVALIQSRDGIFAANDSQPPERRRRCLRVPTLRFVDRTAQLTRIFLDRVDHPSKNQRELHLPRVGRGRLVMLDGCDFGGHVRLRLMAEILSNGTKHGKSAKRWLFPTIKLGEWVVPYGRLGPCR